MNYSRLYDSIIEKYGHKTKLKGMYMERHHIIPRCLGGIDDADNLVYLDARCHLLVHWILTKIYPNNEKLIHAFFMMCTMKNGRMQRKTPPLHVLAEARVKKSEALSKRLKGTLKDFNSPEAHKKRAESAIRNGSYRGLNNGKSRPVDVYNYFTGELVASRVSVTEWGRNNNVGNLYKTLHANRNERSTSKNRHHAKGYYIVEHGEKPYPPVNGEYKGPYSNQGHIGLKYNRKKPNDS